MEMGEGAAAARGLSGNAGAVRTIANRDAAVIRTSQIPFAVDDIQGTPGQKLPVAVNLPTAVELARVGADGVAFILVRNIPPGVKLSAGMASGRLWILPLHDVPGLQLFAEPTVIGSFVLEFNLIGAGNNRLAQQSVALHLQPVDPIAQIGTANTAAVPDKRAIAPEQQAPIRPVARLAPQEEAVLLKRGEELLLQGGIVGARIILEELARKGSAKGALALARSYDPAHSRALRGSGPAPDLEKALVWYQRAQELGSAEARERIAEIAQKR
jgi:hypothetical protein